MSSSSRNGSPSVLGFLLIVVLINYGTACIKNFKRSSEMNNFTKGCLVKAGFDKDSLPTTEDLLKPDFDDKCAAKCIFKSFDLIDDSGHLDKDLLMDFIEDNSPEPLFLKLTELATSCSDSSGIDKVKGTTAKESKAFGVFYKCFVSAANKLC